MYYMMLYQCVVNDIVCDWDLLSLGGNCFEIIRMYIVCGFNQ